MLQNTTKDVSKYLVKLSEYYFFEYIVVVISATWLLISFVTSPYHADIVKPLKINGREYGECEIEGKKIFSKSSFSFWNYYFTGNTFENHEILYEDKSGRHVFLSYKKEIEEDEMLQYICDDFDVLSIYYTPQRNSDLLIMNNPFSKKIILNGDIRNFFDKEHRNVCSF